MYFDCHSENDLKLLEAEINALLRKEWPLAIFDFIVPETIFEKLFESDQAVLIAKVSDSQVRGVPAYPVMAEISERINALYPEAGIMPPAAESYIEISAIPERLLLYDVD